MKECQSPKLRFRTRKQAWVVAINLHKTHRTPLTPYKCKIGKRHWHLTSKQPMSPPKKIRGRLIKII